MILEKRIVLRVIFVGIILSITSCSNRKFNVYLLDDGDCNFYQKARNVFIKEDVIYTNYLFGESSLNKFYYRSLSDSEKDSLEILINDLSKKEIKSKYYKHLTQYCYMLEMSISFSDTLITTSVYDTILPEDISKFYRYLSKLSIIDSTMSTAILQNEFFDDFKKNNSYIK